MKNFNEKSLLFYSIFINLALLFFSISNLSISYKEAEIFYLDGGFLHILIQNFAKIFGLNDYAVRLPFLLVHIANSLLIYEISKPILNHKIDRILSLIIYIYLPGVLASAILINEAGFIILLSLLFVYFWQRNSVILTIATAICSLFVSYSFIIIYIAILLFGLYKKDRLAIAIGVVFCLIWLWLNGINTQGKPKGHLPDSIGVFAAVFSPFVFLCFVYGIYKIWVKEEKNLIWFIAVTSFLITISLSMRQKQDLELFLPFCVIATPIIFKVMINSYRIRLPQFRTKHKIIGIIILLTLFLNSLFSIFHDILYAFLDDPDKHFAYKYDVAKNLAKILKDQGITAIKADKEMALRLKFYGIDSGDEFYLSDTNTSQNCQKIEISKFKREIFTIYICKK